MLTVENAGSIDFANMPLSDVLRGNAMDTHYTLKVYSKLREEMEDYSDTFKLFYESVIKELVTYMSEVSFYGIPTDRQALNEMSEEVVSQLEELKTKMITTYGLPADFNFNSGEQLIDRIYCGQDASGDPYLKNGSFNLYWPEETDKQAPSTNRESLQFLVDTIINEVGSRG